MFFRAYAIDLDLAEGAYDCLLGSPEDGGPALLRALAKRGGAIHLDCAPGIALRFGRIGNHLARAIPTGALAARQAADIADAFGLDPSQRLANASIATRQRTRLATAIAARPALLLLDNPLAAEPDPFALAHTLRAACQAAGITVLHATPRRDEAFTLADTVFLLHAGKILQHGTPATLYERPDTLDIALRTGPGTPLPGTIVARDDDTVTIQLRAGPRIDAAAPPGPDCVGHLCHVLLRPERIAISPLAAADLGGTAIAGLLRAAAHLGDTIRLTVAIGTDTELIVSRPSALGSRGLTPGRQVSLAWQPHHALTFLDRNG